MKTRVHDSNDRQVIKGHKREIPDFEETCTPMAKLMAQITELRHLGVRATHPV